MGREHSADILEIEIETYLRSLSICLSANKTVLQINNIETDRQNSFADCCKTDGRLPDGQSGHNKTLLRPFCEKCLKN